MMTHKEKKKLARRLSGRSSGGFTSPAWDDRKMNIKDTNIKKGEIVKK